MNHKVLEQKPGLDRFGKFPGIERSHAVSTTEIYIAGRVYGRRTIVELIAARAVMIVKVFESALSRTISAHAVKSAYP